MRNRPAGPPAPFTSPSGSRTSGFVNLRINDTPVTEENRDRFVEIERDKVKGLTFTTR